MIAGKGWINTLINLPLKWDRPDTSEHPDGGWGWLPWISVINALGVLAYAFACSYSLQGSSQATLFYWISMLLMFVPASMRLVLKPISRREAVGLLVLLSIGTFMVPFLGSPQVFRGFDEFLHWRTAFDILQNQRLFTLNSLLPVSPHYPGLESATTALVNLTGLNIIESGFLVIGVSRLIMFLGLFLLYEQLTRSVRAAGVATLVYMGSSTFLYFDSQFGYETLALPLMITCLFVLFRRIGTRGAARWVLNLLVMMLMFTVVSTHHVTSYMLMVFLIVWICTDLVMRWFGEKSSSPFWMAALLITLIWIWVALAASDTITYLTPIVNGALNSFYGILFGTGETRQLFQNSAGQGAIMVERWLAIVSVLVLGISLGFGLWQWLLRHRRFALATAFAAISVVYPALPLMRLSGGSWDMANRLSGFVFIGLAFTVALAMMEFPVPRRWQGLRQWLVIFSLAIIYLGGIIGGSSPNSRMPQPYRPAAGERSVENEGLMAAEWARAMLGPDNRFVADRTDVVLIGAYGVQRMITDLNDRVSVSGLMLRYNLTPSDYELIRTVGIRYVAVDQRISTVLSTEGYYVEEWEQMIVSFLPPPSLAVLEKFNYEPGVSRIYDSGNIVFYDLKALNED